MIRTASRVFPIFVILALSLCDPQGTFPQSRAAETTTSFSIAVFSKTGDADEAFAAVMTDFIVAELENQRLDATAISRDRIPKEPDRSAVADFLATEVTRTRSDYLITVPFSRDAGNITFDFYCLDTATGLIVSNETAVTAKQLLIDIEIRRLIASTVSALDDRLARAPKPEVALQSGTQASGNTVSGVNENGSGVGIVRWSLRPEAARFRLSVGVGAFRTIGRAEEYFRSGVMPISTGDFGFITKAGRFGVGLRVGSCFFDASNAVVSANGMLMPFALSTGFTSYTGTYLDIGFALTGGGSLLSLRVDDEAYRTKMLPFASVGASVVLRLTAGIGIRAGAEAMAYFERETPIFGYSPFVSIEF